MPRLPVVSGRQVVRALEKLGFVEVRQRGSHVVMRNGARGTAVPLHREIATGTLSAILRQCELTEAQFRDALR